MRDEKGNIVYETVKDKKGKVVREKADKEFMEWLRRIYRADIYERKKRKVGRREASGSKGAKKKREREER